MFQCPMVQYNIEHTKCKGGVGPGPEFRKPLRKSRKKKCLPCGVRKSLFECLRRPRRRRPRVHRNPAGRARPPEDPEYRFAVRECCRRDRRRGRLGKPARNLHRGPGRRGVGQDPAFEVRAQIPLTRGGMGCGFGGLPHTRARSPNAWTTGQMDERLDRTRKP